LNIEYKQNDERRTNVNWKVDLMSSYIE